MAGRARATETDRPQEHRVGGVAAAARALPELRAALHADPQAKVVELDGLNHLLQPAATGMPSEYGQIPQTMSPAVPEMVSAWIGAHAG